MSALRFVKWVRFFEQKRIVKLVKWVIFFASFCWFWDFVLENLKLKDKIQIWGFESFIFCSKFHIFGGTVLGCIIYTLVVTVFQPWLHSDNLGVFDFVVVVFFCFLTKCYLSKLMPLNFCCQKTPFLKTHFFLLMKNIRNKI